MILDIGFVILLVFSFILGRKRGFTLEFFATFRYLLILYFMKYTYGAVKVLFKLVEKDSRDQLKIYVIAFAILYISFTILLRLSSSFLKSIKLIKMDDFVGEPCNKIVIFMSVFNVHVNRSPIDGEIKLQKYYCGRFRPAYKDEVGFENEHHLIGIDRGDLRITVKQIAGILARRIVSWVTLDDRLRQGDIYGMIRFGSCLEVVMPARAEVLVEKGEKVQGGKTILGRLESE